MTTIDRHPDPMTAPQQGHDPLARSIERLKQRLRARIIGRAAAQTAMCVTLAMTSAIALDRMLKLPGGARFVLLLAIIALFVWMVRRWVLPAWKLRPTAVDLALMLGNTTQTETIAALIDLAQSPSHTQAGSHALRERIIEQSAHLIQPDSVKPTWRRGPIRQTMLMTAALLALIAGAASLGSTTQIGLARLLTPWSDAQWPVRFGITLGDIPEHHPVDRVFLASLSVTNTQSDPKLRLRWRVVDPQSNASTRWSTTIPTKQNAQSTEELGSYEQPIAIHTLNPSNIQRGSVLEYESSTIDDTTRRVRIPLIHPPKLSRILATVTPPDYAAALDNQTTIARGEIELDPAAPILERVLDGSRVEMRWVYDSNIDSVAALSHPDATISRPDSKTVGLTLTPTQSARVWVQASDEYGYKPRSRTEPFIQLLRDEAPRSVLEHPSEDRRIGTGASIRIEASFTDDLGLKSASVQARDNDTTRLIASFEATDSVTAWESDSVLQVGSLGVQAGDSIELIAQSEDIAGARSSTTPRILQIVSDEDILDELRESLLGTGASVRRIDDAQRAAIDSIPETSPQEQGVIGSMIDAERRRISDIFNKLTENNLSDEQLESTASGLDAALEQASERSSSAQDSLERSDFDRAADSMDQVRDALARAAALVDRGEDTWLARRSIDALRRDIQRLNEETRRIAQEGAQKAPNEMSNEQRESIESIAQQQREAAARAQRLLDELDTQSENAEQSSSAQAIRNASQEGRQSGLSESLEQGAEQLEQNQTESAQQSQQDALEALERMVEELDRIQELRDDELQRLIASLVSTLQILETDERAVLTRLDEQAFGFEPSIDNSQIAIQARTLVARDRAAEELSDAPQIAELIASASESMGRAVAPLRNDPIDAPGARPSILGALSNLSDAIEEAQRVAQQAAQRQAEREREQIRDRYTQALDTHNEITEQSAEFVGQALDRRKRSQTRRLAAETDQLNETLEEIRTSSESLSSAPVFSLAHNQLRSALDSIAASLRTSPIPSTVSREAQRATSILEALIEALGDPAQSADDAGLQSGNSGGGGGGGGSSGSGDQAVPPLAQLMVLRTLQEMTTLSTRLASDDEETTPEQVRELAQMQRAIAERAQELIDQMNPPAPLNERIEEEPVEEALEP